MVYLFPNIFELEEIVLQKKMSGFLELDIVNQPFDTIREIVNELILGIKKIPISEIMSMSNENDKHYLKKPSLESNFQGVRLLTIKSGGLKSNLKEELPLKKDFPNQLILELGDDFFFKRLKIPKNKYLNFLDYCSNYNIESLYEKSKILEVIKILIEESKSYLIHLKKNK
jgi:hypothetical protein